MKVPKLGRVAALAQLRKPPASKGTQLLWPRSIGRQVAVLLEQPAYCAPRPVRGEASFNQRLRGRTHSDHQGGNRQRRQAHDFAQERKAHCVGAVYEEAKRVDEKPLTESE